MDENNQKSFGIVIRIIFAQVFVHNLSPVVFVVEVIKCAHGPGSSILKGLTIKAPNPESMGELTKLVPAARISPHTYLFLPAIAKDVSSGYTHNIVDVM